jgi:hypothetical protein
MFWLVTADLVAGRQTGSNPAGLSLLSMTPPNGVDGSLNQDERS